MKLQPFPLIGQYRFGWIVFWLTLILQINALVLGLVGSIRGLNPGWMVPFGILAVLLGWVLGGFYQKKPIIFAIGVIAGMMLLALFNSGASTNLFYAFTEALKLNIVIPSNLQTIPRMEPLFFYLYSTILRFTIYFQDIALWFSNLLQFNAGFNPSATTLIWGSLFWSVLFTAGWLLCRKTHAFIASLPVLVLLTSVLGYTRQNALGLILALGSTLILMAFFEHLQRENHWNHMQIDYSEELRFDLVTLTIPVVIVILIIAWVIPNISIDSIRDFYDHVFRIERSDQVVDSLGLEQLPLDSYQFPQQDSMPRSHLLGSGPELLDIIVMEIDTKEIYLPPQVSDDEQLPKYYWFGLSYDIYTGDGWKTSQLQKEIISANSTIQNIDAEEYRIVSHSIRKTDAASPTLFTPGIPQSVDQRIITGWREATNEYFSSTLNSLEYQVTAPVLNLDEESLRQVDQPPPDMLLNTYLQLPMDMPLRVLDLAKSLTQDKPTPYEKAKSIETYLRGYEYSIDLPTPPENRDLVDYFLFDLKIGYCDYYASAMVVLARAAGLPSRIAIGYATGRYDYNRQVFVVTEANAHAWPEVYIAPYGWVPFEPTASLATFVWLTDTDVPLAVVDPVPEKEHPRGQPFLWLILLGFGSLVLAILLMGFLWYRVSYLRNKSRSTTYQIERVYYRMRSHLMTLFFTPQTEKTPQEYHQDFSKYLADLSTTKMSKSLAHQIITYMASITHLYEFGVYSTQTLLPSQIKNAVKCWREIQVRTWLLKILFTLKYS